LPACLRACLRARLPACLPTSLPARHLLQRYQTVDQLPTRLRYGLTGTPFQNDYTELFDLMDILAPGGWLAGCLLAGSCVLVWLGFAR
jgi:hypothetical protein